MVLKLKNITLFLAHNLGNVLATFRFLSGYSSPSINPLSNDINNIPISSRFRHDVTSVTLLYNVTRNINHSDYVGIVICDY